MRNFIEKINRLQGFIENEAASIVGKEAVDHFKQSFQDEGFSDTGKKDKPWKEVERRKNPARKDRAAAHRKILTGRTGDLADAIDYKRQGSNVLIVNDKVYAAVHNLGLRAGRGKGFRMPKRQFIGRSRILTTILNDKVGNRMKNIMR